MRYSSTLYASVLILLGFAANGVLAQTNSSPANTASTAQRTDGTSLTCSKSQVVARNPTTGAQHCVETSSINYNASKSNTGNIAMGGPGGASRGAKSTSSPRYHCGKGEYMLQNGDCVPNPPSKPND